MVGISFVMSVPEVTVAEIVLVVASMVAVTGGFSPLNAKVVMAFAVLFVVEPPGVGSGSFLQETVQSSSRQNRMDRVKSGVFMSTAERWWADEHGASRVKTGTRCWKEQAECQSDRTTGGLFGVNKRNFRAKN
jgi:hypothetical protein